MAYTWGFWLQRTNVAIGGWPYWRFTWNSKQPLFYGCFNWRIPSHYIKNGCFTKHPFINGCLGFQVYISCWKMNAIFPLSSLLTKGDFWASSIGIFEYDNNGNDNQQPTTSTTNHQQATTNNLNNQQPQQPTTSTTNHQQALVSSNSDCFNVFPATFNGRQGFLRQQGKSHWRLGWIIQVISFHLQSKGKSSASNFF